MALESDLGYEALALGALRFVRSFLCSAWPWSFSCVRSRWHLEPSDCTLISILRLLHDPGVSLALRGAGTGLYGHAHISWPCSFSCRRSTDT